MPACSGRPALGGGYRGNTWSLYVRDSLISSGTVSGGDSYSRANPFTFNLGSGGPQVLQDISVNAGDVLRLELVKTGVEGDYVGVNFGILVVPEPSTAVLLLLALPLWLWRRRS